MSSTIVVFLDLRLHYWVEFCVRRFSKTRSDCYDSECVQCTTICNEDICVIDFVVPTDSRPIVMGGTSTGLELDV